ncbi:MAG: Fic family protein [Bacilli bacterium]|nr:Fic family protein [Bacilli bacterium]
MIPFCLPQFIYSSLDETLKKAKKKSKKIKNKDQLLVFFTKLYSDLDIIHPFREGNGRTEREYLRQFMDYVCKKNNLEEYFLDYSKVKKEEYINAIAKADATCQYDDLLEIFSSILRVKNKKHKVKTKDYK